MTWGWRTADQRSEVT